LVVEFEDALTEGDGDGFHDRSLPRLAASALHYLCKRSKDWGTPAALCFRVAITIRGATIRA
jgi:hypothetical protein